MTQISQIQAGLCAWFLYAEPRGAPVKDGRWWYRLLLVEDPDGNQLFFNYPNEPKPPRQ